MIPLRRGSIRQKLTRVSMLTSVTSIGLTCLAFVGYELATFHDHVASELASVAQVIGANTTAALSFEDPRAANDTLRALHVEPRVVAARVFDRNGRPFADYGPVRGAGVLPETANRAAIQAGGRLAVWRPIELNGDLVGHIYLEGDLLEIRRRLTQYVLIALGVLGAVSALAFGLSRMLQGIISNPLLALAKTAEEVAVHRDYSVRAVKESDDETGQVIDRFNEMLTQIQTRDIALQQAHRVLETRVDERTMALRAKIDEQRRTEEDLVVARDAAEAASRAKSAFLATMSHELRTPLNAIIGYSEMLQEEALDVGQTGCVSDLGKITSAGRHLLTLINDILDLSKIEAGRMELTVEPFELPRLVADVAVSVRPLVEKNGNTLTVDTAAGPAIVAADAMRVRQALLNLVSNAAKFTERGAIRVTTRTAAPWVQIAVQDTGIGLAPEEAARLFTEFTQADASTTRKYGGSGLGLAISQRLCRLMGGAISVDSVKGRGSTFTISLPLDGPQTAAERAASTTEVIHV
ncbi:MAG: ATP-binding protein [Vicinamibacterales bacterium]